MKHIRFVIKNGSIQGHAEGYKGPTCDNPLQKIQEALGAKVEKSEQTHEAFEREETGAITPEQEQYA